MWELLFGVRTPNVRNLSRPHASSATSGQGAESLLDSLVNYEQQGIPAGAGTASSANRFDLARMRKLLHAIGNPQQQLKAVHIAGSKGAAQRRSADPTPHRTALACTHAA